MWNWKYLFEDKDLACYCDIDNIINPEADEDSIYLSIDCYHTMPAKTAAWMMFFIKKEATVNLYREYRMAAGLPTEGYENFNNVICLVELDAENYLYRVIPAGDYDENGNKLGTSAIITDKKKSFLKGIKAEWSPILKGKTHKSIFALFRFIYGSGEGTTCI